MQGFSVILTLKKDGIIEKELCSVKIGRDGGLLRSMYAVDESGQIVVKMRVTTEGEVEDWQYEAIYDYYDAEIYDGLGLSVAEASGDVNPVWEISFPYIDSPERLSQKIEGILNLHKRELSLVLEAIKEAEGEYAL